MLQLYILRHGQTDYSLNNIVQGGGIDSNLNETGREQAQSFHRQYLHLQFDAIVSSQLQRTYQTIQPFEQTHGSIRRMPEFNELNWGILEGEVGTPAIRQIFMDINRTWDAGNTDQSVEGGESPDEAWIRLQAGMNQLVAEFPENARILLCTHGRVMRILLSGLLGRGIHEMNQYPHHNTALNLIFREASGTWKADRLNDLSHLPA